MRKKTHTIPRYTGHEEEKWNISNQNTVYRKEIHTNRYLNYESCHSQQ